MRFNLPQGNVGAAGAFIFQIPFGIFILSTKKIAKNKNHSF